MWSVIVCAYYYLLCTKIEDWEPVKKCVQAIAFFIVLLFIMQLFGKDTLVNFSHKTPVVIGIIGNRMIASSFMCVLAPFLLFNPLNLIVLIIISFVTWSSGAVLSIGAGLCVYGWMKYIKLRLLIIIAIVVTSVLFAYKTGDFSSSTIRAGRLPVYKKTLELAIKRPIGYGIGVYKILFEYQCGWKIRDQSPGKAWRQSHCDWLQILYETGFPGFILFVGWLISIIRKVRDPIKLAGLTILAVNMLIHFPMRVCNSVFIILAFLAFCSQGDNKCSNQL
jgi:O-antigen ligase